MKIDVNMNFKSIEKMGFDEPTGRMLLEAGREMARAARDRVVRRQRDGDGKRIPNPKSKRGFRTTKNDPRLGGRDIGQPSRIILTAAGRRIISDRPDGRNFPKGYTDFKRQLGAAPKMDASLTGAMWDGLAVSLGKRKGGKVIRIHFKGTSPSPAYTVTARRTVTGPGGVKTKAKVRVRRTKVKNQDKANAWQRRTRGGKRSRTPKIRLLGVEPKLIRKLLKEIIRKQGLVAK